MNLSPRNVAPHVNGAVLMHFTGHFVDTAGRLHDQPIQSPSASPVAHGILVSDIQAVLDVLSGLTREQQKALKTLLEAERKHASRWWTYLNEMRFSGDMPDWAKSQDVGTHPDYDRWDKDRKMLNLALFGSQDLYPLSSFLSVRFDL